MSEAQGAQTRLRVGLLDADPIRVVGFVAAFERDARIEIVPVDLSAMVADLTMRLCIVGLHGIADVPMLLAALQRKRPDVAVVLMGPEASSDQMSAFLEQGTRAYLDETVSTDEVASVLELVSRGEVYSPARVDPPLPAAPSYTPHPSGVEANEIHFTSRELDVLRLLIAARSNREIARKLGIEERTVKAHVAKLMRKVGVDNRIALSVYAVQKAIFEPRDHEDG